MHDCVAVLVVAVEGLCIGARVPDESASYCTLFLLVCHETDSICLDRAAV